VACCRTVATRIQRQAGLADVTADRLRRRTWPILGTLLFVCLGTVYFFRWGSVVRGQPSSWVSPDDLWSTFVAAVAFSHGHFSAIYKSSTGFLAFPGILILLAPVAALSGSLNTTVVEIAHHHHPLQQPQTFVIHGTPDLHTYLLTSGGNQYFAHPQALLLLGPYTLLLSCSALFACDALAERLGVAWSRRAVLVLAEAAALWNVSVFWGHPEDAVSVALALYGVVFALDDRWVGAGWLFGLAFAMQPLVIVILPVLLFMSGRQRALTLVLRGVIPAAVITIPPLVANIHATVHTLTSQPAYPRRPANHRTPWAALAPTLGGKGGDTTIGGGPVRLIALALAVVVGWWSQRWRNKPEMLVWAMAVALALRCFTESVMTAYYVWPALAVALVVAARGSTRRFVVAIVVAISTTIVAQWHLGEWPWWSLDMAGVAGLLVVSIRPEPSAVPDARERSSPVRGVSARNRLPASSPRRQTSQRAVSQKKSQKKSQRKRKTGR